ncbi:MAG: acylphosphatase [Pseudomonadota bacterium]|nr:acylphosphatase [Sphingobium naphthae]MEC7933780.1 acylphosphatase [Pseudomonadota bacterium]MEC8033486.1 acylphosphatase [Pseudomonadota bacterium]
MPRIARHLTITGKVQGVWFRAWTVETAQSLGLTGWVRNRTDGSVEAIVEGDESAVDQFLALAQDGPAAARVAAVETEDVPVQYMSDFHTRPTA